MFRLPRRSAFLCVLMPLCAVWAGSLYAQPTDTASQIRAVRFWSFGDVTRIAIETTGDYQLKSQHLENPYRLFFDFVGAKPGLRKRGVQTIPVKDSLLRQIRVAETQPGVTRVVFDLEGPAQFVSSQLANPSRLIIEVKKSGGASSPTAEPSIARSATGGQKVDLSTLPANAESELKAENADLLATPAAPPATSSSAQTTSAASRTAPESASSAKENTATKEPPVAASKKAKGAKSDNAKPSTSAAAADSQIDLAIASPARSSASGSRTLTRVLGLKMARIVIDAGHGGHDTGTNGPKGLTEKDLVLDVALRLGELLEKNLGSEVIYTRKDDTFIPLEQRTKIANDQEADLFISIHANSSPSHSATGVETYYFNFTDNKSALDLASRENATSTRSIHELNDLLRKIVLNDKLEESREFAHKVQTSLSSMASKMNSKSKDRGVKRAPFVVLIGAQMPSILAEIGFVSNPQDAAKMKKKEQRQKIAEALYKGIAQYARSLSHVQVAQAKKDD